LAVLLTALVSGSIADPHASVSNLRNAFGAPNRMCPEEVGMRVFCWLHPGWNWHNGGVRSFIRLCERIVSTTKRIDRAGGLHIPWTISVRFVGNPDVSRIGNDDVGQCLPELSGILPYNALIGHVAAPNLGGLSYRF